MTSLDVATATSSRAPIRVVDRTLLWSGGVADVKVPKNATLGSFEDGDTKLSFYQFARNIPGGVVNFFLHDCSSDQLGRTVRASVEIYKKKLADKREFLYVDLKPVRRDTDATHRLAVMPAKQPKPAWPAGSVVFETPAPIRGAVLLTAPDEKIVADLSPETPRATGDSQLNRLLADGWEVGHQDAAKVYLTKGNKSLVHHRPQARKKK